MNKNIKELLFLHFLNDGFRTTYLLILPFIAKDLFLNYTQSGFLGSTQSLVATFLAVPSGFIASKIGGYKLITSIIVIYSFGFLSIGLSPNLTFLIFAYLLGAVGFGMFHTASFVMIAKMSNKTNVGRNMGDFTSIGEIGRVAIPPLAILAVSIIGWRQTMISASVAGFLMFIIFRFLIPRKDVYNFKNEKFKEENHKDFAKNLLKLFKIKKFVLTAIAAVLDSFASSPVYVFLPFLVLSKGLNSKELGIITAGLFMGSLFGKILLGRFSDRLGNKKVFIVSELSMAVVLILVTLFPYFLPLLFFSFILGAFTKGTSPVIQAMFSKLTHKDHYNKVYAVSEVSIALSSALTIILMGVIGDKYGIPAIFYTCAILAILAIIPVYLFSKSPPALSLSLKEIEQKEAY
ncbi:MAG: MFS transporter [Candidatus Levybacteria bacterium]|nr:MFS transporter [Candidatus Levybacteria bacterium]